MSIHIKDDEVERLLAEIAMRRAKDRVEILLELLRAEQSRLADEMPGRLTRVRRATVELRATLTKAAVLDRRSPDEIVTYDDDGMPR